MDPVRIVTTYSFSGRIAMARRLLWTGFAPHIRPELDIGYRIEGQSVVIFEIRPAWQGAPGEMMEHAFAKATWVRTREVWRIFWLRQDLQWHGYEPAAEVGSIEVFCRIVDENKYHCFFG